MRNLETITKYTRNVTLPRAVPLSAVVLQISCSRNSKNSKIIIPEGIAFLLRYRSTVCNDIKKNRPHRRFFLEFLVILRHIYAFVS